MRIVECFGCGAAVERRRRPSGPVWCSDRCRKRLTRPDPALPSGDCPVCGTRLERRGPGPLPGYCSDRCRKAGRRRLGQGLPQDTPIRPYTPRQAQPRIREPQLREGRP